MLPSSSPSRAFIYNRRPRQSDLEAGQLGINAADGTAWTKLLNNQIVPLQVAGASGGGGEVSPPFELPVATASVLGGVRIGANVAVTADGTISVLPPPAPFVLPVATAAVLGGVRIGSGISVGPDGTISAQAQAGTGTDLGWNVGTSTITSSTGAGARLTLFTGSASGLVQASGGGQTRYLRADHAWVVPPDTTTPLSDAITSTDSAVAASSRAVSSLNALVQSERVAKAGDTMTGHLNMAAGRNVGVSGSGAFVAAPASPGTSFVWGETAGQAAWLGLRMDNVNSFVDARNALILNAASVNVRPAAGGQYDFATFGAVFTRMLFVRSDTTNQISLQANSEGHANIQFTSWDNTLEFGAISSSWGRTELVGREQAWLRGGSDTGWGQAEMNGGWREWEAVRFSRGGTHLASVDGNGNYVNRISGRSFVATRGTMPGLDEVLRLQPVALASRGEESDDAPAVAFGFDDTQLGEVIPEAVGQDGEGVIDAVLTPVLVKAIQELEARLKVLEDLQD